MPGLGLLFLLASAAVVGVHFLGAINQPAFAHGAFAVAALPLMLGAMLHFIPVLTRSGAPARGLAFLPWLAAGSGVLALTGVAGWAPRHVLLLAALLLAACVAVMIGWVMLRLRRCLGAAHPGVYWYLAALGCLLLGMTAVFGMLVDTARFLAWRALHLHVNLFGWIGLTALGTLPVLLPTSLQNEIPVKAGADAAVLQRSGRKQNNDPDAAGRLKRLLWPAIFGVLALAVGSALSAGWLAAVGALLSAAVPCLHLRAWLKRYGVAALRRGAAASLVLATAGFVGLLAASLLHGFGGVSGEPLVGGFVFAFLLPLVLGALAQLLPVWCFPGPETAARVTLHAALAHRAEWRALACLLAALLQLLGSVLASALAAVAVVHFAATLWFAWRRVQAAPEPPDGKGPAGPL